MQILIKHLGINVTKKVKELYNENYETSMKEVERYLLSINSRFSAIPIKIPMIFFTELELKNPKICNDPQKISNSQRYLGQKE